MKTIKVLKIYFVLTILTVLNSCKIFDASRNEIIRQECGFGGIHKAVLFLKPGNATVNNSIHLCIIDCIDKLEDSQNGNVFVADSEQGDSTDDSLCMTFTWQSNDTLKVFYDSTLRIFKQETLLKDLVVIYEKK